jgi:tetratricopeptide (TPR) repeat protein
VLSQTILLCCCSGADDDVHQRIAERHRVEAQRLISLRKYKEARTHLEDSIRASEKIQVSTLDHALSLTSMGDLNLRENNTEQAIAFYQKADKLYRTAAEKAIPSVPPFFLPNMMSNGLALADALFRCGKVQDAEAVCEQVRQVYGQWWQSAKEHRRDFLHGYVEAILKQSLLASSHKEFGKAEELLVKALDLVRESGVQAPGLTLKINEQLAVVQSAAGRPHLGTSLAKSLAGPHGGSAQAVLAEAASLDSKGCDLHRQGKFSDAVETFRKSLDLRIKANASPILTAVSHEHLADALFAEKNLEEALAQYQKAREIKETLPAKSSGLDYCLHQLGNIYAATGRRGEAEAAYRKSFELKQMVYGKNSAQAKSEKETLAQITGGN